MENPISLRSLMFFYFIRTKSDALKCKLCATQTKTIILIVDSGLLQELIKLVAEYMKVLI